MSSRLAIIAMIGATNIGTAIRGFSYGLIAVVCLFFSGRVYSDNIYVGNFGNNTIEEFNSSGSGSVFDPLTNYPGDHPNGIAFDGSGNLYVAMYYANTIIKISPSGQESVFANTDMAGPIAVAVDSRGDVFVSNSNNYNSYIEEYNSSGQGTLFYSFGFSFHYPLSLAFDGSGNLYAGMYGNNDTIVKFDTNANESVFASGLADVTGLAFDSSGNLYASQTYQQEILKFTTNGTESIFATNGLDDPYGIAFDSSGNLYAANWANSTIEKYGTNGVGSLFASSGANQPEWMAIEVPEPSALLLLGIGIVTLWVGFRWKQKSTS
jgi:sugar lactone lactonase YvrE